MDCHRPFRSDNFSRRIFKGDRNLRHYLVYSVVRHELVKSVIRNSRSLLVDMNCQTDHFRLVLVLEDLKGGGLIEVAGRRLLVVIGGQRVRIGGDGDRRVGE